MHQPGAEADRSTTNRPDPGLPKAIRLVKEQLSSGPLQPAPRPTEPELAVESLAAIGSELTPLFIQFWKEFDRKDALDIDWRNLMRLEAMDQLLLLTVRDNGSLVGFVLNIIQPRHLFFAISTGTTIAYWLDPVFRRGGYASALFKRNLDILREKEVKRVYLAVASDRVGKLVERLGYVKHEIHYTKVL